MVTIDEKITSLVEKLEEKAVLKTGYDGGGRAENCLLFPGQHMHGPLLGKWRTSFGGSTNQIGSLELFPRCHIKNEEPHRLGT